MTNSKDLTQASRRVKEETLKEIGESDTFRFMPVTEAAWDDTKCELLDIFSSALDRYAQEVIENDILPIIGEKLEEMIKKSNMFTFGVLLDVIKAIRKRAKDLFDK